MAEHFADYARRALELEELRELTRAIKRAVEPFDPGDIHLVSEQMGRKVLIHASCSNWPSKNTVLDVSEYMTYAGDVYMGILRIVAEHFVNIEYITPEPHLELGEN